MDDDEQSCACEFANAAFAVDEANQVGEQRDLGLGVRSEQGDPKAMLRRRSTMERLRWQAECCC